MTLRGSGQGWPAGRGTTADRAARRRQRRGGWGDGDRLSPAGAWHCGRMNGWASSGP